MGSHIFSYRCHSLFLTTWFWKVTFYCIVGLVLWWGTDRAVVGRHPLWFSFVILYNFPGLFCVVRNCQHSPQGLCDWDDVILKCFGHVISLLWSRRNLQATFVWYDNCLHAWRIRCIVQRWFSSAIHPPLVNVAKLCCLSGECRQGHCHSSLLARLPLYFSISLWEELHCNSGGLSL